MIGFRLVVGQEEPLMNRQACAIQMFGCNTDVVLLGMVFSSPYPFINGGP